jgi:hypothetical protein
MAAYFDTGWIMVDNHWMNFSVGEVLGHSLLLRDTGQTEHAFIPCQPGRRALCGGYTL